MSNVGGVVLEIEQIFLIFKRIYYDTVFINVYNSIIRCNIEHISGIKRIIQGKALYYAIIFIVFKQVILSEVHLDISILIENTFNNMS